MRQEKEFENLRLVISSVKKTEETKKLHISVIRQLRPSLIYNEGILRQERFSNGSFMKMSYRFKNKGIINILY